MGTMIVEIGMLAVGVWLYSCVTRGRNVVGRYLFAAYVGLLLALYVANRFSPPPPSPDAVAWLGMALSAVFIPWAWWFDQNRTPTPDIPYSVLVIFFRRFTALLFWRFGTARRPSASDGLPSPG